MFGFIKFVVNVGEFILGTIRNREETVGLVPFTELKSNKLGALVQQLTNEIRMILLKPEGKNNSALHEKKSLFEKAVRLHALRELMEMTLNGGVLVGLEYLTLLQENNGYKAVLKGKMTSWKQLIVRINF